MWKSLALSTLWITAFSTGVAGQVPTWTLSKVSSFPLPEEVGQVRGIVPVGQGDVVLLDQRAPFLHRIDAGGRLVRSWVSAGEGPGAARSPRGFGLDGGRIWLWDFATRRMTWYSVDGKVAVERRLTMATDRVQPWPGGRLLDSRLPAIPSAPTAEPITRSALLLDERGGLLDTLSHVVDPGPVWSVESGPKQFVVGIQPLAPLGLTLGSAQGPGLAVALPLIERRGGATAFRLIRYGADGKLAFDGWVPIAARDAKSLGDSARRRASSSADRTNPALGAKIRDQIQVPAAQPAFSSARLGPAGETWFAEFDLGAIPPEWFVVSRAGRIVGRFRVPAEERVVDVIGGDLWTTGEGANGEPTLTRWTVVRRP